MDFQELVVVMRDFIWDNVLLYALLGLGIYLTVIFKFPQFTRVVPAFKDLVSNIIKKTPAEPGGMTPFQSLATAVAAQVGTGNIVGVATAIGAGGPGAAFWMLVSGFFGMATIFAEAALAQVYRERDENGELVGGPAYYIKNGLNQKWLAYLFAIICVLALGVVGIMVQSNSIITSMNQAFNLSEIIITVGLMLLVGWILIGGMQRIASFSEKVVPVMAFAYVFAGLLITILNLDMIIPAVQMILVGAFQPQAIAGGALGIGIQETIRYGLSRGLFSNEAGMGSTPHSHAVAITKHPAEQGFVAMIGVFICTFVICVTTVIINLFTGAYSDEIIRQYPTALEMTNYAQIMTQSAFGIQFGRLGEQFLSISLSSFSLTTIVGWYFFAESNVKFILRSGKSAVHFKIVALAAIGLGMVAGSSFIWDLADLAMGLMAIPNIIALLLLSRKAANLLKDYDSQKLLNGEALHFDYLYEDYPGEQV